MDMVILCKQTDSGEPSVWPIREAHDFWTKGMSSRKSKTSDALPHCLQTLDIIFYGDSITESWRGLQVGVPVDKFKGIPEIFGKAYGGVRAAAYSISGTSVPVKIIKQVLLRGQNQCIPT